MDTWKLYRCQVIKFKIRLALSLFSLVNFLQADELDILNLQKTQKFILQLESSDFNLCSVADDALNASFNARSANLLDTSIKILEGLINCNPSKKLYYSEMLQVLQIKKEDGEALRLIEFATQNLSDTELDTLVGEYKKIFRKPYYESELKFIPTVSDNYNSGINADFIEIFNFPFRVDDSSKPRAGVGLRGIYQIQKMIPSTNNQWDKLNLSFNVIDYPRSVGDIGIASLTYNKQINTGTIIGSVSSIRVDNSKYLTSSMLGYNHELNINKSIWLSFKKDEYKNDFQSGDGIRLGYIDKGKLFENIYLESYEANTETYSYSAGGLKTRKVNFFNKVLLSISIEKNVYKDKFAVFQKTRNGEDVYLNIFTKKIFGKFFKISIGRRKSNIEIFDTKNINLEIVL